MATARKRRFEKPIAANRPVGNEENTPLAIGEARRTPTIAPIHPHDRPIPDARTSSLFCETSASMAS